jgi:lambda family phage portal protein
MAQVFEAGEAFIRVHLRRFGESAVPLGLELIESERLADEFSNHPMPAIARGSIYRMGVELDEFYRPLAYLIHRRHAGEIGMRWSDGADQVERVPADEIFHLRIISRWPQTRGEPWLHAVARRLNDMDGYAEAEITAARGAASYLATIETPDGGSTIGEEEEDGVFQAELTPGIIEKLMPGEKLNFVQPNRPNTALDPFMRYMLREVAAGAECSYESLSRDYSQSNYSSSRLALLDDRDTWRALQQWWIRNFREPLHRKFMQQAVLARAIQQIAMESYALDVAKYAAVRFKPRGWTWIDPTKEVEAFERAVRDGFITTSDVIAQTGNGRDLEDVLRERERELGMMKDAGLVFDTDPSRNAKGDEVAPTAGEATAPQRPPPEQEQGSEQEDEQRSAAGRLEAVGLGIATALGRVLDGQRELARRPDPAPPVVNFAPPAVHVEAPITVQVPDTRDEHVEVVERDENGLSKRMIIRREAA